ncbi:MAG: biopolymer transporter ExbD [Akkermansiaceae bacterium]|nr:biopolymer transporter ExbD [Akkermansiaceae bacterium]
MKSRTRHHHLKEENQPGFQIAPMIDVVFVILLFFMVAAGNARLENAHRITLPSYPGPQTPVQLPDEIRITVDADGQVYLNDDPVSTPETKDLAELAAGMAGLKQAGDSMGSRLMVTIQADEGVKYERVVDVLDVLIRTGVQNVTFGAGSSD